MIQTGREGSLVLSKNDYLIAGSISGFVSRAIAQPLDVVKIRFQLQVEPISASDSSKYHGFAQAIRCINKEEGAFAFWKGHIPAQLQAVTFSAIQFLSFEILISCFIRFGQRNGSRGDPRSTLNCSKTLEAFTCGCVAGSIAAGVTQPLDVLRTRFIAQGEPKLYT
ncbi:unnamed protein product [Echinostoma caproni]|uniref:Mitochondrial thiamine pyrophosphate carrier n=1 Tax=Echinostoma caproni TaxID=27848 RepID=A0A183A3S6_9TREM|nr:unnamed protein product [Echinostoma caproni]